MNFVKKHDKNCRKITRITVQYATKNELNLSKV